MARPKEKEVVIDSLWRKHTYKLDKKTGKKKTWRPSAFTEEIVQKLEEQFSWDCSVRTACAMAGVSESAYYAECERNPQFKEKMERAQQYVGSLASRTIAKAIRDGDSNTAKWYQERRDERFKKDTKVAINATTETDPETGTVVTWLEMEFTLKDEENS